MKARILLCGLVLIAGCQDQIAFMSADALKEVPTRDLEAADVFNYAQREKIYDELRRRKEKEFVQQLGWADSLASFESLVDPRGGTKDRVSARRRKWYVENNPDLSPPTFDAILSGHLRLGMTTEQARASWGLPYEKNRSVYTFGIHEQWVYGKYYSTYVYFEDRILTAWQD